MKELLANLNHLKLVIGAGVAIVTLLLDKKLGPAEDDLPLRFKLVLIVPIVGAVFHVQNLTEDQRGAEFPYLFGFFIVALLAYSMIWTMLGYTKVIATPRPWWKFWGDDYSYPKTRVMGGCLLPEARNIIQRDGVKAQEYFEDVAYSQDHVWTRGSRACSQAILILTYIVVVGFYTAAIAMTVV